MPYFKLIKRSKKGCQYLGIMAFFVVAADVVFLLVDVLFHDFSELGQIPLFIRQFLLL